MIFKSFILNWVTTLTLLVLIFEKMLLMLNDTMQLFQRQKLLIT